MRGSRFAPAIELPSWEPLVGTFPPAFKVSYEALQAHADQQQQEGPVRAVLAVADGWASLSVKGRSWPRTVNLKPNRGRSLPLQPGDRVEVLAGQVGTVRVWGVR